jgi:UDP-N-acetylglucosamine--N-acetylmuramyl-(pentapeptide) pyrophosphoryl-undecaprenol N-acetylglucosamine transferase
MNIVIAAGGTGGHLYPAVALAHEFLRQDPRARILFVGTARGIESKVLAHEGFELRLITAKPVMGRGFVQAATALLSLPIGIWQSIGILRRRRADLVIGVGGYTSPAVLAAAFLLGIPRVILEPNASPGMANKAVGPFAQRVFLAFESAGGAFAPSKVRVVGTPIRREFYEEGEGREARGEPRAFRLLIFGGSQGAKAINSAMIEALPDLTDMRERLAVTHQTGDADHARVSAAYQTAGFRAEVVPFLYDMPRVLRAADLVVSRAGAITIAEVTACGKPAILIPLPQAIYNHQARNAQVMESAGAAVVLPQAELTGSKLARAIRELLQDPERLTRMSARSLAMGRTDAAAAIVRECYALIGGDHETDRSVGARST